MNLKSSNAKRRCVPGLLTILIQYTQDLGKVARCSSAAERKRLYTKIHAKMNVEVERQFSLQGYYVPFNPMQRVGLQTI
jgi:hypothetical protein